MVQLTTFRNHLTISPFFRDYTEYGTPLVRVDAHHLTVLVPNQGCRGATGLVQGESQANNFDIFWFANDSLRTLEDKRVSILTLASFNCCARQLWDQCVTLGVPGCIQQEMTRRIEAKSPLRMLLHRWAPC
jgi:hypothetical protein